MIGWYSLKFSHHWGNQVSCSLGPKSAPPPSPLFGLVSRGELWSARCWGSARALSTHRGRTCSFWCRRRQAAPAAQTDLKTFFSGMHSGCSKWDPTETLGSQAQASKIYSPGRGNFSVHGLEALCNWLLCRAGAGLCFSSQEWLR